jgi:ABC-type phosphate/phosphonate transport system substrate-binding protein
LLDSFLRESQNLFSSLVEAGLVQPRNSGTGAGIMFGRTRIPGAVALLALILGVDSSRLTAEDHSTHSGTVRIGLIHSVFNDVPEATVVAAMQPFSALMEAQTGVGGQLVPCGDASNLGQQLMDDKVQLGVFHGIEFAWARLKYPELRPLMIAINQERYLRACLVVRADSKVTTFGDLKDKVLSMPQQSRDHCQLFVRQRCQESKKDPASFFAKITSPANAEDALDEVVDGTVQGSVVDSVSLECYKRRKPGRFGKLKIAQPSETFPAAVVVFRPGILDEALLARFREGLLNANRTAMGRQVMTLMKLTGFEQIPPDYEQILTDIAKAYPPPAPNGK